jgi:aspartate beta-hydroxylase
MSREIEALLQRGEDFAAKGDPRGAVSFFNTALRSAGQTPGLSPSTIERLRSAQAFIRGAVQKFEQALDEAAGGHAPDDPVAALRLAHALDLVKGKRELFPQQPSMLFYPYLAQRQFFERSEFAWAAELEAATAEIRAELEALLAGDATFRPYVEDDPDRPARDFHGLNNNPAWTALYLWKHGKFIPEIAERCPRTVKALERVPLSAIGSRTPSVFFSRLEPGAHIPPHTGMLNMRLICHLPLIVPDGCWLRVGNETREWREGELLIFDDSIEHEARNPSADMRIVLIFDIWRPELSQAERDGVSAIFDAIDRFSPMQLPGGIDG